MVEYTTGDLLEADVEALVNAVNCVGVMGKGIALRFKGAYPDNFRRYAAACKAGEVVIGSMFVVEVSAPPPPRVIINFPTKRYWRDASHIVDIQAGLVDLVAIVQRLGLRSIAVPALGCGNGGLDWAEVRPLIAAALRHYLRYGCCSTRPQRFHECWRNGVPRNAPCFLGRIAQESGGIAPF